MMVRPSALMVFRTSRFGINKDVDRMLTARICQSLPGSQEAPALAPSIPIDTGDGNLEKRISAMYGHVLTASAHSFYMHLLNTAWLLQEENGQAYRSCELKVSFKSIFHECLGRAKEHFAAKPVESVEQSEEPFEQPEPEPLDPRAGYSGEADQVPVEEPEAPRIRGPQLPGATVGAVAGESGSESDGEAGPRGEGEEREGVDLRYVDPEKSGREEWMTMAPDSISTALPKSCQNPIFKQDKGCKVISD